MMVSPTPTPSGARFLAKIIHPLYRLFDWLYTSRYNPLYRSGTLTVGFLILLLLTGLYLSFFYSVSNPYESLKVINNQVWLGSWIRTLHRYATVAALIAIFFHVLQLLLQGKTWGPRTLAWLSGIFLTILFFTSAWTGYVMVWDTHGQRVAIAGAKMLAIVPVLKDVVLAAFDGTAPLPAGFFFMNLFLHVALPVMLIMFLWVHTAKLSRAVWFPIRPIMAWSTIGLFLVSILWPAPLLDSADLLQVVGRIPIDAVSGFWISWIDHFGVHATWLMLSLIALPIVAVPWIWRPARAEERSKSSVDVETCSGCTQCAHDCPYEAIRMVPRRDGRRLIAEVDPSNCVSCGICAASCADSAIGPPGRTANDQRERVVDFCKSLTQKGTVEIVYIFCTNNLKLSERLNLKHAVDDRYSLYPVECCGCTHTEVIEQILQSAKGLVLIGCPARNCFNRDGGDLLSQRIYEKRVPFLDRSIDRERILITSFSEAEGDRLDHTIAKFEERICKRAAPSSNISELWVKTRIVTASAALLTLCAYVGQIPSGQNVTYALVRVAGLMPSATIEDCHAPTAEELAQIPLHMRPKEICQNRLLEYTINVVVDEAIVLQRSLRESSGKVDRPIFLDLEVPIAPGRHQVNVKLKSSSGSSADCSANTSLQAGEVFLAHYQREKGAFKCRT